MRAAEVQVGKDGRKRLRRYAQVGLPPGYVVDGEIHNVPGVVAALKRLWAEGGFTSNEVVLGVSGPRVFVRQADVAAMPAEDLRSALKFDAQELIPISMDEACFDYSVLGPPAAGADGKETQRILLVAAHRELLSTYLAAMKGAGLSAVVMDAAPLALMRAVPVVVGKEGSVGVEVIVSVGAELTTVAVREKGVPRFIRSLTVGGDRLTGSIAQALHVEMAVAEGLKRGALPPDSPAVRQARKAMSADLRDLADEVRATIDFFASQSGGEPIDRLLLTGAATQTEGLALAIASGQTAAVMAVDPLAPLDLSALDLDQEQIARVSAAATTAIGLALWSHEAPLIRLSMLPEDVLQARQAARRVMLAGAGLAGLVGVLAVTGAAELYALHSQRARVHDAQAQVAVLTDQVNRLRSQTSVHTRVQARAALDRQALQGDVDWVRVLGQLSAVMPTDVALTSFQANLTPAPASGSGSTAGSASSTSTIGTMTVEVTGTGGLPAVSAWLQGLQSDPDLSGAWVTGVSVKRNGGAVTFASNAALTPVSESHRDQEVGK